MRISWYSLFGNFTPWIDCHQRLMTNRDRLPPAPDDKQKSSPEKQKKMCFPLAKLQAKCKNFKLFSQQQEQLWSFFGMLNSCAVALV